MTYTNITSTNTKNPLYVSTIIYLMDSVSQKDIDNDLLTDVINTVLASIPADTPENKKANLVSIEIMKYFKVMEKFKRFNLTISDKPFEEDING